MNELKPNAWLTYSYYEEGGQVRAGDENEDWPNYEDTIRYNSDFVIHRTEPCGRFISGKEREYMVLPDLTPLSNNRAFLVYALYSDGGTFGSTRGYVSVLGVFGTAVEACAYAERSRRGDSVPVSDWYAGADPKDLSMRPWSGYFARLESVEVEEVLVVD